jgi:hypothetical protein
MQLQEEPMSEAVLRVLCQTGERKQKYVKCETNKKAIEKGGERGKERERTSMYMCVCVFDCKTSRCLKLYCECFAKQVRVKREGIIYKVIARE